MTEKQFELGRQNEVVQPHYKDRLLKIINDIEETVRVVNPDQLLHKELHEKKVIDARKEAQAFEGVRKDVCEAFGVPFDGEHIYLHTPEAVTSGPTLQRAFRAFYVLIDAVKKEAFYGEGRIDHNTLLNNAIKLLNEATEQGLTVEEIFNGIDETPPKFIVFKGFVSKDEDGFGDLTSTSNRVLETPIFDENGQKIETPSNWFITGHNLSSSGKGE